MRNMESFIRWVIPRLGGDDGTKEVTIGAIMAAMFESNNCGLDEAADLVDLLAEKHPSRHLVVATKAIRDLAALNRDRSPSNEAGA